MAEFLISRRDASSPTGWTPITVVQALATDEPREIAKQGYQGPDRYAVARWDTRREFDLNPGPVQAADPPA